MNSTTGVTSLGLQGCLETCRRCEHLVRLFVDPPGDYPEFGVIGPDLKHCLDHFRSLFLGLQSGTIDYDTRATDVGLETDPQLFLADLYQTTAELAGLEGISTTQAVQILQAAAPNMPRIAVGSTLERELIFLSTHTIHHLAQVIENAVSRGAIVPLDLGLAFSTEPHPDRQGIATR